MTCARPHTDCDPLHHCSVKHKVAVVQKHWRSWLPVCYLMMGVLMAATRGDSDRIAIACGSGIALFEVNHPEPLKFISVPGVQRLTDYVEFANFVPARRPVVEVTRYSALPSLFAGSRFTDFASHYFLNMKEGSLEGPVQVSGPLLGARIGGIKGIFPDGRWLVEVPRQKDAPDRPAGFFVLDPVTGDSQQHPLTTASESWPKAERAYVIHPVTGDIGILMMPYPVSDAFPQRYRELWIYSGQPPYRFERRVEVSVRTGVLIGWSIRSKTPRAIFWTGDTDPRTLEATASIYQWGWGQPSETEIIDRVCGPFAISLDGRKVLFGTVPKGRNDCPAGGAALMERSLTIRYHDLSRGTTGALGTYILPQTCTQVPSSRAAAWLTGKPRE